MEEGEILDLKPEETILEPQRPGAPMLLDDVFPPIDIRGEEEKINAWFENDIKRCAIFVSQHQAAWDRWQRIYDLESTVDLFSDIGGRADFPAGLLTEKTIEGIDRLMRAIYAPDPIFAVHEASFGEEQIEDIIRYEQWMNYYCRDVLGLESQLGKRAFLDFLLFGSVVLEPDTMFKIVPQRTIKTYSTRDELEADQELITDTTSMDEKFDRLDSDIPVRMVVERENVEEMGLNIFQVDLMDHLIPPQVYRDDEIRFRARRLYYTESDLHVLASSSVGWYQKEDVDRILYQRSIDVSEAKAGRNPVRYDMMRKDAGVTPGYEWLDANPEYGDKRILPYENVFIVFRIFARYAYRTRRDPRGVIPKWTVWDWEPCSQTILRARTYPHFDERLPWIHFRLGMSRKSYYGFGFGALLEKEDSRQTSIMNVFLDSEAMAAYPPYLARSPEAGGMTPFRFGMGPGQVGYVHDVLRDFKQLELRGPSQNLLNGLYPISSTLASNRTGITPYTMGQTESTDPRSPARKTELLLGQAQLSLESIIRDWNVGWEQLAQHIWKSAYEATIIRGEDERAHIVAGLTGGPADMARVTVRDLEKNIRWLSQASAGVVNPQARKADFLNKFSFFIPLIQRLWEVNPEVGARYFLRWIRQAANELELRGKQFLVPSEEEMLAMPQQSMQGLLGQMQDWAKGGGMQGITPQPEPAALPAGQPEAGPTPETMEM
jgi:hypothetical protein